MNCDEARKIFQLSINEVKLDKLIEAEKHIRHCTLCKQFFKERQKARKEKFIGVL